jgi:hypothetical protein
VESATGPAPVLPITEPGKPVARVAHPFMFASCAST